MDRETKTLDPADLDEMRSDANGEEFFRPLQSPERQRAGLELLASHVRRLVAEVARLTAERDAILRWSIRHAGWIGKDDGFDPDRWWARGEHGIVRGAATAEAAVRRAAGLEEETPR
jgi:hypothetical protein